MVMFEYAFTQEATLRKNLAMNDRYNSNQLSDEGITINVLKFESVVRVETQGGFEFANKSVFITNSILPDVKDVIDGQIVKGIKPLHDIYGNFVYMEIEFV